jgi:uncharacterized protein
MEILKIAITGPVGAGKTSFIRAVSEIEVVDTDRRATDETSLLKENTTVAFDFGRVTLNSGQVVHLYGTPGQSRFDFMWNILMPKVNAYILLVDAQRPQDFRNARKIFNNVKRLISAPTIIGLTHTDCEGAWEPDDVILSLGLMNDDTRPPIVIVNPTQPYSVIGCLIVLVEQLMKTSVN